jgi:hypothetical protein
MHGPLNVTLLIYMSKSSENFFSCNLVNVMLFDGSRQIFFSYVLLQESVVIFNVQTSVVVASLRASRKDSTGLKLLDCNQLERLVDWCGLVISSRRPNILLSVALQPRGCQDSFVLRFPVHTQLDTVGRTSLNGWSTRRRGRYLHNTQQTQDTNFLSHNGIWTRYPSNQRAGVFKFY